MTSTTAPAGLRAWALDLACYFLDLRLGRLDVFAQREAVPAPTRLTRPAPGEWLLDLPRMSIAVTDDRRRAVVDHTAKRTTP